MEGGMLQHEIKTKILGSTYYCQVYHVPTQGPGYEDQFVVEVVKYKQSDNPISMRHFKKIVSGNKNLIKEVDRARDRKYRELKKKRDEREATQIGKRGMPK